MDHMGPLGEEGFPLGLGAKGCGPSPPPPCRSTSPLGSLVPHGGGEEDGTPLGLYKEGYTALFPTHNYSSLSFSFLEVASPCLESAPGLDFSATSQAVVLLESRSESVFLPLLAWFGAREEHR